jgi:transcriptional regulator with XRE-family HTH domain
VPTDVIVEEIMNPIERLERKVHERFPQASLGLLRPVGHDGRWSLEIDSDDQHLIVEWQPERGFGLSSFDENAFGEGHDETYPTLDETWGRVRSLLLSRTRTMPSAAVQLRRLRECLDVSQVELARSLNVGQGTISKLEHRSDVLVSTLASVVSALGGSLQIIARFPSRTIDLLAPEAEEAAETARSGREPQPARRRTSSRGR